MEKVGFYSLPKLVSLIAQAFTNGSRSRSVPFEAGVATLVHDYIRFIQALTPSKKPVETGRLILFPTVSSEKNRGRGELILFPNNKSARAAIGRFLNVGQNFLRRKSEEAKILELVRDEILKNPDPKLAARGMRNYATYIAVTTTFHPFKLIGDASDAIDKYDGPSLERERRAQALRSSMELAGFKYFVHAVSAKSTYASQLLRLRCIEWIRPFDLTPRLYALRLTRPPEECRQPGLLFS